MVRGVGELVRKFLDGLLLNDGLDYSEKDWIVHRLTEDCRHEKNNVRIGKNEVRAVVFAMGRKKAPRYDEITAEVLIKA